MKSTMKFLAGFLPAVVMVITMPGVSYAQFGDLKAKAVETLTNGVMKELEKKYKEIVEKEAISAAAKANIVNKLSEMSRPIVKKFIDGAMSGKLPNQTELVNMVLKDILPRVPGLVAAVIAEGDGLDTKTASTGAADSTTPPTGQSPTAEQIQSAVNAQLQHNYDDEKDFTVEIINEGSAVRIIRYTGKNTELRIPPRIGDRPVAEIGEHAFIKKGVVSVVIPESVIFIGNMAFAENQIGSVSIGANVYIANNAFDSSGNNSFSAGFYNSQGRKAGTYTNGWRLTSSTTTERPQVEEMQTDNKNTAPATSQKSTSGVKSHSETRSASVSQLKPVTIATIAGVTIPGIGRTPVKAITENAQYTGTVTWSPAVSETFEPDTKYTATITLTAKNGFTLQGVAANFFKIAGAVLVSNNTDNGIVTAVFPATSTMTVNSAKISGVTIPAAGKTPVTEIVETEQYTGIVTWSPAVSETFEPKTRYTATITLTAKSGYTLEGVWADFFKVAGAKATNEENSGIVTAVFPSTKYPEDAKLWTLGASVGTAFDPLPLICTVYGTIAQFKNLFIEIGVDMGWRNDISGESHCLSYTADLFSLYPFANFAVFVPFARTKQGKRMGGWYAGIGLGVMFVNYKFEVEQLNTTLEIWDATFAMNIVTGFILGIFDISYTIQTDCDNHFIHKLSLGYVYRFK